MVHLLYFLWMFFFALKGHELFILIIEMRSSHFLGCFFSLNPLHIPYLQVMKTCIKSWMKVKSVPGTETEATKTQIQPFKPKRVITYITNRQNTKRTYGQPSEQLFPKRWSLSNRNRTKNNMIHKVNVIEKQWTGTWAIKRQLSLLKPNGEINKISRIDKTQWEQIANRAGSYFPKVATQQPKLN